MNLKLTLCMLLVCSLLLSSDGFWSGRRRRRFSFRGFLKNKTFRQLATVNCRLFGSKTKFAKIGCGLWKRFGDEGIENLKELRHQDFKKYDDALQQIAEELSSDFDPQEVADGLVELDRIFAEKNDYDDISNNDVNDDVDFLDLLNDDDVASEQQTA
ncbi:uncharacterized protein LOC143465101 [Clavelina lepadiformis]|uniref:uncharacterized protein LOC143465101 n=1 Tax=Clavelina lepadiformis TaxID=159417 RepID=UPI0040420957